MPVIKCNVLTPGSLQKIQYLPDVWMVIHRGKIETIHQGPFSGDYLDYGNKLIIPPFCDLHNHMAQYRIMGLDSRSLLEWLDRFAFPEEIRLNNDPVLAGKIFRKYYRNLIQVGTLASVSYASSSDRVCRAACEESASYPGYLFMGKVLMERNAPQELVRECQSAMDGLEQLIADFHDPSGRLRIVATPRFAISCSYDFLKKIAAVAYKYGLLIQTHLSENRKEIDETLQLFPEFKDYTDIYEQSGLLGERTLLGHGIYLSDDELDRISRLKATIVHCPTSNGFLQSGIFGVRRAWAHGVRTGLGTDIGAGYSLSMFSEMRNALEASKYYALFVEDYPALTPSEVFYTATLGNANILGLGDRIGSIEPGKQASFLVLDHRWEPVYASPHDLLSGLIYRSENQIIREFWIDGEKNIIPDPVS